MNTYKVIFVKYPQLFKKLRVNRLEFNVLAKSIKHGPYIAQYMVHVYKSKLKKQKIKDFELLGVIKVNDNEKI